MDVDLDRVGQWDETARLCLFTQYIGSMRLEENMNEG